jgi:hypothetical protein
VKSARNRVRLETAGGRELSLHHAGGSNPAINCPECDLSRAYISNLMVCDGKYITGVTADWQEEQNTGSISWAGEKFRIWLECPVERDSPLNYSDFHIKQLATVLLWYSKMYWSRKDPGCPDYRYDRFRIPYAKRQHWQPQNRTSLWWDIARSRESGTVVKHCLPVPVRVKCETRYLHSVFGWPRK